MSAGDPYLNFASFIATLASNTQVTIHIALVHGYTLHLGTSILTVLTSLYTLRCRPSLPPRTSARCRSCAFSTGGLHCFSSRATCPISVTAPSSCCAPLSPPQRRGSSHPWNHGTSPPYSYPWGCRWVSSVCTSRGSVGNSFSITRKMSVVFPRPPPCPVRRCAHPSGADFTGMRHAVRYVSCCRRQLFSLLRRLLCRAGKLRP